MASLRTEITEIVTGLGMLQPDALCWLEQLK